MQVDIKNLRQALKVVAQNGKEAGADALNEVARLVQSEARSAAPQGPTGNLKRAIEVKVEAKPAQRRLMALVKVNKKIAPHAFWVENGSKGKRRIRGPKAKGDAVAYKTRDGQFIHAKTGAESPEIGPMPASRFFRKGVTRGKRRFVTTIKAKVNTGSLSRGL